MEEVEEEEVEVEEEEYSIPMGYSMYHVCFMV